MCAALCRGFGSTRAVRRAAAGTAQSGPGIGRADLRSHRPSPKGHKRSSKTLDGTDPSLETGSLLKSGPCLLRKQGWTRRGPRSSSDAILALRAAPRPMHRPWLSFAFSCVFPLCFLCFRESARPHRRMQLLQGHETSNKNWNTHRNPGDWRSSALHRKPPDLFLFPSFVSNLRSNMRHSALFAETSARSVASPELPPRLLRLLRPLLDHGLRVFLRFPVDPSMEPLSFSR